MIVTLSPLLLLLVVAGCPILQERERERGEKGEGKEKAEDDTTDGELPLSLSLFLLDERRRSLCNQEIRALILAQNPN